MTVVQGARAALLEAGLHSEKMAGSERVVCELSAVIGQRPVGEGPERNPQGNPEELWREGEACARDQPVMDVAWEAWVHDAGWVKTEVGLGGQEVEPESLVNVEKAAFEGGAMFQAG